MKFKEKLQLAARTVNKAQRGREQGLKENTISSYIATGSIPRADIALKIARAVGVPLEWLIDDAQAGEPPDPHTVAKENVTSIPDADLIRELLRRRRHMQLDIAEKLDRAEAVDWSALRRELESTPADQPPPRAVHLEWLIIYAAFSAFPRLLAMSNIKELEATYAQSLSSGKYSLEQLDKDVLAARYNRLAANNPDFRFVMHAVADRPRSKVEELQRQIIQWAAPHGIHFNVDKPKRKSTKKKPRKS